MIKEIVKYFSVLMLLCLLTAFGPKQDNEKIKINERDYNNASIEMADAWRANGKIYVVIATVGVIMLGFIGYLFVLDRRVAKMEKEVRGEI
ncbi:MAG: CcmD family protein [Flammeovirgaceae bacterium]